MWKKTSTCPRRLVVVPFSTMRGSWQGLLPNSKSLISVLVHSHRGLVKIGKLRTNPEGCPSSFSRQTQAKPGWCPLTLALRGNSGDPIASFSLCSNCEAWGSQTPLPHFTHEQERQAGKSVMGLLVRAKTDTFPGGGNGILLAGKEETLG